MRDVDGAGDADDAPNAGDSAGVHDVYLAISHYFNKTASPSPVMFWTVKAPFWYALVAPRPMEEPALFAPGSHPAGVPGRLGGTPIQKTDLGHFEIGPNDQRSF